MKLNYAIASLFALTVGVGVTLAANAYFSMKSELDSIQNATAAPALPVNQPVPAATEAVAVAPPPVKNFDDLPLCEQMDALAKSGKSIAQFIAQSGRYSEFAAHVTANCNWHAEQLKQANAILHPPVVTVPTIIRQRVVVEAPAETPAPVITPPSPTPSYPKPWAWNNCNGIQEPGESYSVACHKAQADNDLYPNQPQNPLDKRQTDDFGNKAEQNGYYQSN